LKECLLKRTEQQKIAEITSNKMEKYVIITGAYGGLGRALAHTYSQAGYGLILIGRKKKMLESLKKELEDETKVYTLIADVRNWKVCNKAAGFIKKNQLPVKVLINNAGISYIKEFVEDYDLEHYRDVIETNLYGPVYMTKLFLQDLIENNGTLINISSVLGYAPVIGRTAYAASKFGLEGFTSVLKAELNDKLHILMVYPTFIKTGIRSEIDSDKTVNEILTAESVANSILEAQNEGREYLYLGKTAKLSYFIYKFYPKLYVNLMRRKVGNLS
jgi:short-subunit dehydrogenase